MRLDGRITQNILAVSHCCLDRILKIHDVLYSGCFVQDPFELWQKLMACDDGLHLRLIDTMDCGVLSQVGVECHHGEGLLEAGLG